MSSSWVPVPKSEEDLKREPVETTAGIDVSEIETPRALLSTVLSSPGLRRFSIDLANGFGYCQSHANQPPYAENSGGAKQADQGDLDEDITQGDQSRIWPLLDKRTPSGQLQ